MIHGPHTLTSLGLPRNIVKLDAILVWGHTGTTYLFSGYQYWKMEQDHLTIRSDYPKEINAWNGVTYPVTSAVRWTDGKCPSLKRHEVLDD